MAGFKQHTPQMPTHSEFLAGASAALQEQLERTPDHIYRPSPSDPEEHDTRSEATTEHQSLDQALADEASQIFFGYHKECASHPDSLRRMQIEDEAQRLWQADGVATHSPAKSASDYRQAAARIVDARWQHRGLHAFRIQHGRARHWAHEHRLRSGRSNPWSIAAGEMPSALATFGSCSIPWRYAPGVELVGTRLTEVQTQYLIYRRQLESSRPFFQYVDDILQELERMQNESWQNSDNADTILPVDAISKADDVVRRRWQRYGIWDDRWGTLPGLSWGHELPEPAQDAAESTDPEFLAEEYIANAARSEASTEHGIKIEGRSPDLVFHHDQWREAQADLRARAPSPEVKAPSRRSKRLADKRAVEGSWNLTVEGRAPARSAQKRKRGGSKVTNTINRASRGKRARAREKH